MYTKIYTKYHCSICNTKSDQLSHVKAHINTKKHKDKCIEYARDLKIFSHEFRQISPLKWEESSEKDYIIKKYLEETNKNEINQIEVKQWIIQKGIDSKYNYDGWSDKKLNIFKGCSIDEYYDRMGILIKPNFDLLCDDEEKKEEYIEYSDWAIDKIIRYLEKISERPEKMNKLNDNPVRDSKYKRILSHYTSVKFDTLQMVRNGFIDLYYLTEPPIMDISEANINIEIYNDTVTKYACILFYNIGIWHLSMLYDMENGAELLDTTESPESKYDQTFYFHKNVEIVIKKYITDVIGYDEDYIEKKNIWVSCDMEKFCDFYDVEEGSYTYIDNEFFKTEMKNRLLYIYQKKIDAYLKYQPNSPNIEYYLSEKQKILDMDDKTLNNIIKVCEYLLEYDEELIKFYKTNKPVIYTSIQKRNSIHDDTSSN
jgi:hypothetical protein